MPKYRRCANDYDYFVHLNTGKPCTTCGGSGDQPFNGHSYLKCTACNGSGLAKIHNGTKVRDRK